MTFDSGGDERKDHSWLLFDNPFLTVGDRDRVGGEGWGNTRAWAELFYRSGAILSLDVHVTCLHLTGALTFDY